MRNCEATFNQGLNDQCILIMNISFQLIFAFVPPPSIWGGWLTFIVGLVFMGVLTALIGDLASIFGCLIGLKDAVTAITFVALGTSLPDLFASKTAATREKTADNAIGNVTGSNGVNVFLGIGLAWFVSSCYWTAQVGTAAQVGTTGLQDKTLTVRNNDCQLVSLYP